MFSPPFADVYGLDTLECTRRITGIAFWYDQLNRLMEMESFGDENLAFDSIQPPGGYWWIIPANSWLPVSQTDSNYFREKFR